MEALTFTILAMGIITVVLSVVVAFKFLIFSKQMGEHPKNLSRAIMWQLIGEAVIGLGTLIFASAAHLGVLPDWPIQVQSGIRFIMFFATSFTTLHLYKTIIKLGS